MAASRSFLRRKARRDRRQLRLEHLEARYVLNGQAVLANDAFSRHENGPLTQLDVLANDTFEVDYQGQRLITSVSFGSEGGRIDIAADGRRILYKPPADFFGTETFVYAVDGAYTAQVSVTVKAPLAFDHFHVPPDGMEHQLDVLANDPFWHGYTGARQITAVSVGSEGGTIAIAADGKSILYTPPDESLQDETFIYVVDQLYPAQVRVSIPSPLAGESYEMVQHDPPAELKVLANDLFWPGYSGERRITHVTASRIGATIEISSDGKSLIYTQPADFEGWRSRSHTYDSFRYVVDSTHDAGVNVVVYRPVQNDWFEVDENSSDYFFDVTLNDTYGVPGHWQVDVIDRVTSSSQTENGGTVTISADGRGIVYTPAPGFSGVDTFTYLADGVHEARVQVNVRRPVRDDYIGTGVYQDTPNGVLDVLANDFLGNGYAGPRLITAVGPTENGGTLTIRHDGKAILYRPAEGYTGPDSFIYTVDGELQASVSLTVIQLAQPDYIDFYPDAAQPYSIRVLENDHFGRGYAGPGIVTAVELVSGDGEVSIQDGRTLRFDPMAIGSHSIRYTVDDKYETTATVWIRNAVFGDNFVMDQNSPAQKFNVLLNDFYIYPHYRYQGPKLITGVTQSVNGGTITIAADGRSVNYQPPVDYHGADTFTYTVDEFMTATVTVEVIRRVRDDQFRVDAADGPQALSVLVNDLFGANYAGTQQITAVTATSSGGTATIGADRHTILYTPRTGFVGTDTFTYTVDGALKAEVKVVVDAPPSDQSPTFSSLEDYTQFLIDDALERYQYLFGQTAWNYFGPGAAPIADDSDGRSHSETNVQVAGVDEGDIVEFDSDYVYMLTDSEVVIVDAWPAEELSVESRVDIEGRAIAEFLHGDRLTVISEIGGGYRYPWDLLGGAPIADRIGGPFFFEPLPSFTIVTVIDVSNRAAPTIVQTTTMEGKYVDSRGVGDFVYVLVSNPEAVAPRPEIIDEDNDPATRGRYETREEYLARVTANPGLFIEGALPNYTSYGPDGQMVRTGLLNAPEDIYQPLVPNAFNLISVVSFNIEGDKPGLADTSAVYSSGASAIYASLDNFYVFDGDYSHDDGAVTRIVKFDWEPADGGVEFAATTTVAGRILNQFSADENGPYLRIATTVSNQSSGNWSGRNENMLFVLQEDDGVMEFVGSLQNLALNETMRSVRFLGERAFVTTFRNVDPLFAVDLTDPARPEAVGHITLPGFTSYMHLIDQDHLLTVGRNTPAGQSGPTQVSLFDISDLGQPLRIAEYTFERFSTSEAELDHHAFGYYAEHGLLGMPVARVFIERVDLDGDGYRETRRSVRRDDLAVFSVDATAADPGERLVLATEIEHGTPVRRSGYIGDKLYSIANDSVKVVDVADLDTLIAELIVVEPNEDGEPPPPPIPLLNGIASGADTGELTTAFPATRNDARLLGAVNRARADLALRLQRAPGAAMLVTADAAPDAPGGGYNLVFRAGDQHYLYRAGANGFVQLVESDYEFSETAQTWHAADFAFTAPAVQMPGDYNADGQVDDQDHAVWRATYGDWSLTEFLPADGNRNGTVDLADNIIWRKNFGRIAGDFDGSGAIDQADYDVWRGSFGSTTDLRADANYDRVVNTADLIVWRKAQMRHAASQPDTAEGDQVVAAAVADQAASAEVQQSNDTQVVTSARFQPLGATIEFLAAIPARAVLPRDDVPRQLAFEAVAVDRDDVIVLDWFHPDADDDTHNRVPAKESIEPAILVQAQAIDLALDSISVRRPFRPIQARW
jgi:Beta propeller domain/Bacterial Ig domain